MTTQGKEARNKAPPHAAQTYTLQCGISAEACCASAYGTGSDSPQQTAGGTRWQSRRRAGARVGERRRGWLSIGTCS
jgi:hypothetical protein